MRRLVTLSIATAAILSMPAVVQAKGCIKGAVVGGVAGHYAGHHAVAGAVGGCALGHHMAKKSGARKVAQARR
ncbi:hypothetical protein D3Y57_17795 [Sphingomonas paeninsulae]|uniref:17 kDa surface antigen n=1 Tax=Sphingomonas paeninsulae TaxID=2319844 RepID=A0A494TJA9_SPHPE|nr:hypothetical protein [Sphingomonas paeninsulae]AYJ87442.1 hypothetical protein D3Y57_17795 [Sphingomonas paeninsulae]